MTKLFFFTYKNKRVNKNSEIFCFEGMSKRSVRSEKLASNVARLKASARSL